MVAIVVAIGVFGVRHFKSTDKTAFVSNSTTRVEKMFENMKSRETSYTQEAVAYWYVGHPMVPDEHIVGRFENFMRQKNIRVPIQTFEMVDAQLVDGDDVVSRRVEIVCKVNGQRLNLTAYYKQPLEWTS